MSREIGKLVPLTFLGSCIECRAHPQGVRSEEMIKQVNRANGGRSTASEHITRVAVDTFRAFKSQKTNVRTIPRNVTLKKLRWISFGLCYPRRRISRTNIPMINKVNDATASKAADSG
ncbi:hypothetical protein BDN67DRAFT_961267 [Paxillus ammoniavirescens]|nr:hypothetical protein BDN67DRAFT_961267 [Paxillus ammoniavirescens]